MSGFRPMLLVTGVNTRESNLEFVVSDFLVWILPVSCSCSCSFAVVPVSSLGMNDLRQLQAPLSESETSTAQDVSQAAVINRIRLLTDDAKL